MLPSYELFCYAWICQWSSVLLWGFRGVKLDFALGTLR